MASRNGDDYRYDNTGVRRTTSGGVRNTGTGSSRQGGSRRYEDDGYDEEYDAPRRKKPQNNRDVRNTSSSGRNGSGRKMSKKARAKKKRRRIIIFLLEIVVLAVMLIVLWGVTKVEKVGKVDLNESDIAVNSQVETNVPMKGYRTIALFGVDSTTGELTKNTRSDTIIIASINQDTKKVKLMSVYRDTYLNIEDDSYNKCNSAYAKGGPEQAINMLNQNLDLHITDFVTVGFEGLSDVINDLGGVSIDVESEEIPHLNNYQKCIAEDLKTKYTPVTKTGMQILDGIQATGYCRIRYTAGNDFRRAQRQRTVLKAIMDVAKKASATTLTKTANDLFDSQVIYTSLDLTEILSLLKDVSSYSIEGDDGFPQENMRNTGNIGSKGSCVVPLDLSSNVKWLHGYLFQDNDYQPSDVVQKYSAEIKNETASYLK